MKGRILIGGDSRTGGSLLARMLDLPPAFLSYPLEHEYFLNRVEQLFPLAQFVAEGRFDAIKECEFVRKLVKFAEGRLTSKQFYGGKPVTLDKDRFLESLDRRLAEMDARAPARACFEAVEGSFFEVLYNERVSVADCDCLTNHLSRSFLAGLDDFFRVFPEAVFVHTLRDPMSLAASLKNYRNVVHGASEVEVPPAFIELVRERWVLGMWHALRNRQRYGAAYVLVTYDALVREPEHVMRSLCDLARVPFQPGLLYPSMGDQGWSGNSSFGALPERVSTESLTKYNSCLNAHEIERLEELGSLAEWNWDELSFATDVAKPLRRVETLAARWFGGRFSEMVARDWFIRLNSDMMKIQLGG